jgi:uncharacterized protein (DUF2267 family)
MHLRGHGGRNAAGATIILPAARDIDALARSMHCNAAMSAETFIAHVADHAGISIEHAERVTRTVLSGLGSYLTPAIRQFIADELPVPLGRVFGEDVGVAVPLEEQVLEAGLTAGQARELVASVCRVLTEQLSTDALTALRTGVPPLLADRLVTPADDLTTPPPEPRRHATLATGRPGSAHPLSESHPTRNQAGSVAEDNPHGAAKLSSSPGMTQERQHETFAEGQPGYDRPLAGARRDGHD